LDEQKEADEKSKINELPWKEINEFGKSADYTGHMCIKVHNNEFLSKSVNMTYQYKGHDGTMQDGAMSSGGGYRDLRTLDRGIQDFFRTCEHNKVPGKMWFSKAAEELIEKWIAESNNYFLRDSDQDTLKELTERLQKDYSPREEQWDRFEYQAIKELGYEEGVRLLVKEYRAWRYRVMKYQLEEIENWPERWKKYGPMDHYIERVLVAVKRYNFHALRRGEQPIEEPAFIPQWKEELSALNKKREEAREKDSFEKAKKRKEDRKAKSDIRKKEKSDKDAVEKSAREKINGTPWTDKMKAAKDANEGRNIIQEYEEAFASIEKEADLPPTIGRGGSGCASRGYSTLSKSELKKAIKKVSTKSAELGEKLKALIDDITSAEEAWEKLYAIEIGKLMKNVHCDDELLREGFHGKKKKKKEKEMEQDI